MSTGVRSPAARKPPAHLQAVEAGHGDVQNDGVSGPLGVGGEARRPVLGQFGRVPLKTQGAFKSLAHRRLVVYDQNSHVSTYFRTCHFA